MPDWDVPPRRSPPPHFHDPRGPLRGEDRFGPRGYSDGPRGPPPPLAGPYDRDDWYRRDPDPVRRSWPERPPPEPAWRDSPPPPGFREHWREPYREHYRGPDYPPDLGPPAYGGGPALRPADYDPPAMPVLRHPPAREVRLVGGDRPRQSHMFAPAPLPETARRELLDPPTEGYNPYGRRVREEDPVAQQRHSGPTVRTPAGLHRKLFTAASSRAVVGLKHLLIAACIVHDQVASRSCISL